MSTDYSSKKFKKLLDKLQQDSWQLELLISGFVIFGLFSVVDKIHEPLVSSGIEGQLFTGTFLVIILMSCYILILNLVLHLILRGLWIGALGLRYVSGDIDFEVLRYTNRFTNYLKKKIVSFDKYIAKLENYCSILFAISFLLIFYLISFLMLFLIMGAIGNFIAKNEALPELFRKILSYTLFIMLAIGTLLTMIDFFTQGFLKKKKIISRIYFPVYKVFSYITLSFLYRPIAYNFLDNKFGKKVSIFLVPIYTIILLLTSFEYNISNFMDYGLTNKAISMKNDNYENMLTENDELVKSTSIQSKVITENHLKIFHVLSEKTDDRIFEYAPDLKPEKDARGYFSTISFTNEDLEFAKKKDSLAKKYVETFNESHHILIDSILYKSDFLITHNTKGQLGFETYLNIKYLEEGKHILYLKRLEKDEKGTEKKVEENTIPFWYFRP